MAECKQCGGQITFQRTPSGRWRPTEMDGSEHFDLCSKRQSDAIKREGVPFATSDSAGYQWRGKRHYTEQSGPVIVGRNYRDPGCDCNIPPWEKCQHSFA